MTTRAPGRRRPRRRPYQVLFNAHDTNTANFRETIATPAKGKRIRLITVKAIQQYSEGRELYEVYFGTGTTINTNPDRAVDTLEIPDSGSTSTQVYGLDQGPRGERNEVLSGRWQGSAPYIGHIIIVEWSEES